MHDELDNLQRSLSQHIAQLTAEATALRLKISRVRQGDGRNEREVAPTSAPALATSAVVRSPAGKVPAVVPAPAPSRGESPAATESQSSRVDALVSRILTKANSALESSEVKKRKSSSISRSAAAAAAAAPAPAPAPAPTPSVAAATAPRPDFGELQTGLARMKRKIFGLSDFGAAKIDRAAAAWAAEMFAEQDETAEVKMLVDALLTQLAARLAAGAEFGPTELRVVQALASFLQQGQGGVLSFWQLSS